MFSNVYNILTIGRAEIIISYDLYLANSLPNIYLRLILIDFCLILNHQI